MEPKKSWLDAFKSKTFIIGLLTALIPVLPQSVKDAIAQNPNIIAESVGLLIMFVGLVFKFKIDA